MHFLGGMDTATRAGATHRHSTHSAKVQTH